MRCIYLLYIFFFLPNIFSAEKYPTRRWLQICNSSKHLSNYINKTTTTLIVFLKENREDLYS